MSKYYYHRMFSALVGESVMTYLRKRRLGRAVMQLNETSLRLIDIALDNQFETEEVFIRAFTKHFGMTPAKYRKLKDKVKLTSYDMDYPMVCENIMLAARFLGLGSCWA